MEEFDIYDLLIKRLSYLAVLQDSLRKNQMPL
ncbi:uncharacterized protein METZ01_LOCUS46135 [marine metagenome]|uniref:Uncharacterized protein n=1 Tax=marine metagenome TaxID=408172 RepID=A0A381RQ49_9ZZZZ